MAGVLEKHHAVVNAIAVRDPAHARRHAQAPRPLDARAGNRAATAIGVLHSPDQRTHPTLARPDNNTWHGRGACTGQDIDQINLAIMGIDDAAQQNAALVEGAAASYLGLGPSNTGDAVHRHMQFINEGIQLPNLTRIAHVAGGLEARERLRDALVVAH